MKIIKINSLTTTLFIFLIFGLAFLLPIVLIQTIWNSTVSRTFDITIDMWQALILWLIVLVSMSVFGVFKFEFAVESMDEEALKKKIDTLKTKVEELNDKEP